MQKLDPQSLFSIFEQGDEDIYREHNVEELLQNPYVLIGMVLTGVENFYLIDSMYLIRHPEEYSRVRRNVKIKYYSKLFGYLSRINIKEFSPPYSIGRDFEVDKALDALADLLFFFESIEEYEKCITIREYIDLLLDKKLEDIL